jgi:hypothetical protein
MWGVAPAADGYFLADVARRYAEAGIHFFTFGAQDLVWGTNSRLAPVFDLDDPDVTVLGEVVCSQGRCVPGFGVRRFPEWASVYIAAPNVPAPVLRGIARFSGVHRYSEEADPGSAGCSAGGDQP